MHSELSSTTMEVLMLTSMERWMNGMMDEDDDEGTDDWRSAREGRRMLGSAGFSDQNVRFLAVCAED